MQGLEPRDFQKRLTFEMEDGRRVVWPVYTVLRQDYKTLVMVYNRINKNPVLGRYLTNEVQQQICKIRRDKAVDDDLPTRMIVPNSTGNKIHFEPFYMMEFRDETCQNRFFRMEDNLKTASNDVLSQLQQFLDDRDEDEHLFKVALQRQLDENLSKNKKRKRK